MSEDLYRATYPYQRHPSVKIRNWGPIVTRRNCPYYIFDFAYLRRDKVRQAANGDIRVGAHWCDGVFGPRPNWLSIECCRVTITRS